MQDCPLRGKGVMNSLVVYIMFYIIVGPDHIKLPQPGPEVADSLNDPYIIYIAKGSPELPQPGQRQIVVQYTVCMTQTHQVLP